MLVNDEQVLLVSSIHPYQALNCTRKFLSGLDGSQVNELKTNEFFFRWNSTHLRDGATNMERSQLNVSFQVFTALSSLDI